MSSDRLDGVAILTTSQTSILALASLATVQNLVPRLTRPTGQLNNCTAVLYKIGKGQLPAGLIATCRTPKLNKHMAGGNDQLRRGCRLGGSAKGKDGAVATNSSCFRGWNSSSLTSAISSVKPSSKHSSHGKADDKPRGRR